MYRSPIEIIQGKLQLETENGIMRAVMEQDIHVDKAELLRALQYDRGQYEKGYRDAQSAWIDAKKNLPAESGEYLVCIVGATCATALWYNPDEDVWFSDDPRDCYPVSRWMPMPPMPEEVQR